MTALDKSIHRVKLGEIQQHPRNARRGNVDLIAASLSQHGQYRPIVVQKSTGHILVGNHTWLAAQQLDWDDINLVYADVDDDEALRILVIDNRTSDLAVYDDPILLEVLTELSANDKALVGTGYDGDDLKELLASLDAPKKLENPDDVPEVEVPTTVLGDIWLLGQHRVMCGDATSLDDVNVLMDGKKANMVFTDPPYGVEYVGKTKNKLTIKNDDEYGLKRLLDLSFSQWADRSVPGAAVYIAHPPGALSLTFIQSFIDQGWRLHQTLCWNKQTIVMGHSDYHYSHEPILFGYMNGGGRRGRGGEGWYGDNSQKSVLDVAKPSRSESHPTMKPVELVEICIRNSSPGGGFVLDTFGGSGSTLIAAHQTGRTCYMMELDPHYVDVICTRFQKLTGIIPVREADNTPHDFLTLTD